MSSSHLVFFCSYTYRFGITAFTSTGGMDMGVFDGCMVAEEFAFGCTGIMTAMEASGLGVSVVMLCMVLSCSAEGSLYAGGRSEVFCC